MSASALEFTRPPDRLLIEPQIRAALIEDMGRAGDITSELTIPASQTVEARLVARKPGRIAGLIAAELAFGLVNSSLKFTVKTPDGSEAGAGTLLATISGPARAILTAERVALNFLGHLSGVATATAALVDAVRGTNARIVCTRKTLPNLRILQKYAVRCGGGFNPDEVISGAIPPPRFNLDNLAALERHVNSVVLEEAALEYANSLEPMLTDRGELIESNVGDLIRRLEEAAADAAVRAESIFGRVSGVTRAWLQGHWQLPSSTLSWPMQ